MKNLIKIIISLFLLFFIGCSKHSDDTNPIGINPIGGGNGNVTVQVSIQQDQQGLYYFLFKPSVSVKLNKIDATLNNNTETVNGDGTTTFSPTEGFSIQVNNPATGDQWSFSITGKIASDNKDFTSTVNYTVPQGFTGGTSLVAFEITSQLGQNNSVEFLFNPSADVKITKVDVEMGGATDVVNGDGTTIYSSTNWYVLAGYNDVASGQQWSFNFIGTIAANNQNYSVTANYTVP